MAQPLISAPNGAANPALSAQFTQVAPNQVQWLGNAGQANITFRTQAVQNKHKTLAEGRPVFEGVVFIRIQHPGETLNIPERPATKEDIARFPLQYSQYERNVAQVPEGTPIELIAPTAPDIGQNMRAQGIHTVEQLAALTAEAIGQGGPGMVMWVNRAKTYLETSKNGVPHHEMQKELEKRDSELGALKETVRLLTLQLNKAMLDRGTPITQVDQPTQQVSQTLLAPALYGQQAQQTQLGQVGQRAVERYQQPLDPMVANLQKIAEADAAAEPVKRGPGRPPNPKPAS